MRSSQKFFGFATCLSMFVMMNQVLNAQKLLSDGVVDLTDQIAKRAAADHKTKIAVLPFRELGGQPTVFGTYLAEELVTGLVNVGGFDLVERATLDKVMGELKLNESGSIDPAVAKSVGKLVGADAIVTGTITDLQSYVAVNCRLIDSETGRIFAATSTRVVKDDDVKKVMQIPIGSVSDISGKGVQANSNSQGSKAVSELFFATDAYRMEVDALHKTGTDITLTVTLNSLDEKPTDFSMGQCSLLDENGERWEQGGEDSGHFLSPNSVTLMPGTKIKSRSQFVAKGANNGTRFTLTCTEYSRLRYGRFILIHAIPAG